MKSELVRKYGACLELGVREMKVLVLEAGNYSRMELKYQEVLSNLSRIKAEASLAGLSSQLLMTEENLQLSSRLLDIVVERKVKAFIS